MADNRNALDQALEALAVGPEHAALVELCRSLADVVDSQGEFDDRAWREYRQSLKVLMEATARGGSDGFDKFLASLRTPVSDGADT